MEGSDELLSIPYSPLSLLVSKDVPAEVQEVLRTATKAACADPDFNAWLESNCIDKLYEMYPTVEDTQAFFTEPFATYRQEYKRRFAWIKSGRIKPEEFYAWSKISREKRTDCETGKISLEEFTAWLKES